MTEGPAQKRGNVFYGKGACPRAERGEAVPRRWEADEGPSRSVALDGAGQSRSRRGTAGPPDAGVPLGVGAQIPCYENNKL